MNKHRSHVPSEINALLPISMAKQPAFLNYHYGEQTQRTAAITPKINLRIRSHLHSRALTSDATPGKCHLNHKTKCANRTLLSLMGSNALDGGLPEEETIFLAWA